MYPLKSSNPSFNMYNETLIFLDRLNTANVQWPPKFIDAGSSKLTLIGVSIKEHKIQRGECSLVWMVGLTRPLHEYSATITNMRVVACGKIAKRKASDYTFHISLKSLPSKRRNSDAEASFI